MIETNEQDSVQDDFLSNVEAADPESFNVCTACD